MRILIIAEVYLPKIDGVVVRTMQLIHHLLEQGDEVLVVCPETGDTSGSPVPVVTFPSFPLPSYPEYKIGRPDGRLLQLINEYSPDVIHYLNPFAFGFRCSDLALKAGLRVPSVFSFHTLYGEFVKRYPLMSKLSGALWWLMKDYHNRADCNLTVSAIMQQELSERGFERVELWPPAVDCDLFKPSTETPRLRRELLADDPTRPLLLTVSRLAPEKNVGFLAGVMRQLPQARLAIVGNGPDREALERQFVGTDTVFLGYRKGAELAEAYASADAFLYASETETMGNVILEAMASGLSVIAPRAGGIPSLVEDGVTGLLYTPRDTSAAFNAVSRVLDDSDERHRLGGAARNAVEHCGWSQAVSRVREHYFATIDAHRSSQSRLRRRRLAPAMVSTLVMANRAVSLASGLTRKTRRVLLPHRTSQSGPQITNYGGLHDSRTEGART